MKSLISRRASNIPQVFDPNLTGIDSFINQVFSSLFDDFDLPLARESYSGYPVNRVFVNEKGDWKIEVALTGFKKEEVEVAIEDGCVSITAQHDNGKDDTWKLAYGQLKTTSFSRKFKLPGRLDAENAAVDFADGILTLTIPIREEAKRKLLQIK